jgi:hypothetical protein
MHLGHLIYQPERGGILHFLVGYQADYVIQLTVDQQIGIALIPLYDSSLFITLFIIQGLNSAGGVLSSELSLFTLPP